MGTGPELIQSVRLDSLSAAALQSPGENNVVHRRVKALADGVETKQAKQFQHRSTGRRQNTGSNNAVVVLVSMELGVKNQVPTFVFSKILRSVFPTAYRGST